MDLLKSVTGASSSDYNLDSNATAWKALTSGALCPTGIGYRQLLGINHLFFSWGNTYPLGTSHYASYNNMTLDQIAGLWNKSNQVSPFLITCKNDYSGNAIFRDALVLAGFGISHRGEGLNALSYDGSGRWISVEKVAAAGWYPDHSGAYALLGVPVAWMMTHASGQRWTGSNGYGNFAVWAKEYKGD
ncbi:MAG: hypothetical protein HQL31_08845 [Planctomycetes bacterium]|nr:hypothetical protein [Planctomycetota bacterium]